MYALFAVWRIIVKYFPLWWVFGRYIWISIQAWFKKRQSYTASIVIFWITVRCECSLVKTHWGRGRIDAISQMTFSSAFSRMKMFELRLIFRWRLFIVGWPNSAQNLVTSRFFHDFMPCSTCRRSITFGPIVNWESSHHGLSNDVNNMAQMFLLAHAAESSWTQFSAKTPLSTRFLKRSF